jgi:type IV pilus assembly protein PilC
LSLRRQNKREKEIEMAIYQFEAMTNSGEEVKDEVEASSQEDAAIKIRNLGYFPTKIREKSAGKQKKKGGAQTKGGKHAKSFSLGRVKGKQLTTFTRQLSTLQDAGLPIVRSIKILESQMKPSTLKNTLIDVAEDIEGGSTLSEAMGKHPRAFDRLYVNMVRAGETGGVLDTILQRLADFREKSQRLKRRVISALIYPVCVISFAGLILTGIMIFIIPQFEQIFAAFDSKLPALTQHLIDFSASLRHDWPIYVAIPFAVLIVYRIVRVSRMGRMITDWLKMKVPVFGRIINKSVVSRFARTLGTLIASGVPILEALNIVRDTAGNEVLARAIGRIHDSIREGESIAEPLRQSRVTDEMVVNMVDVGEETGDLDKMLMKVADAYDEEVDVAVASMMSLLEPLMVICLGIMVGTIVIALFLPLVKLIENLGQQASGSGAAAAGE